MAPTGSHQPRIGLQRPRASGQRFTGAALDQQPEGLPLVVPNRRQQQQQQREGESVLASTCQEAQRVQQAQNSEQQDGPTAGSTVRGAATLGAAWQVGTPASLPLSAASRGACGACFEPACALNPSLPAGCGPRHPKLRNRKRLPRMQTAGASTVALCCSHCRASSRRAAALLRPKGGRPTGGSRRAACTALCSWQVGVWAMVQARAPRVGARACSQLAPAGLGAGGVLGGPHWHALGPHWHARAA